MLVIARQPFHDLVADCHRSPGERFECDGARASKLVGYGLVAIAAEQPKPKRAPRKKATKKGA